MSTEIELEQHIVGLEEIVARRDLALKLEKNREFRKLILEEFCVNECARYAQASANPALKEVERADSLALAQAAGHLRRWLSVIVQMGNQAASEITQTQAAIEEARREDV
jgi:hypothetical protein